MVRVFAFGTIIVITKDEVSALSNMTKQTIVMWILKVKIVTPILDSNSFLRRMD